MYKTKFGFVLETQVEDAIEVGVGSEEKKMRQRLKVADKDPDCNRNPRKRFENQEWTI